MEHPIDHVSISLHFRRAASWSPPADFTGLLAVVLLLLAVGAAGPVQAQAPVSKITDSGGNTLMLVYDNGEIEITGGFLLPDGTLLDESGDLGALSLPFSGSVDSSDPAFEVENTGSGPAGVFTGPVGIGTTNPSNPLTVNGVIESTSGGITLPDGTVLDESGDLSSFGLPFSSSVNAPTIAFDLTQTGGGSVGNFQIANSSSSADVVHAETNGHGSAGNFQIENSSSGADAIVAETDGIGDAVRGRTFGTGGRAGIFRVENANSSATTLEATNAGDGAAGHFAINNTSNSAAALVTETNGSGDGMHVSGAGAHGVHVSSAGFDGVRVSSAGSHGVRVGSAGVSGVFVNSAVGDGANVAGDDDGIEAWGDDDNDGTGLAGNFNGGVDVGGDLSVGGSKNFKIDHPQDPTGKYLYHAAIESSERLNVYSGTVTLGADGSVRVELPTWFESINRDFRYQLTPIGAPGPDLYIAEEIQGNSFQIAGGEPGMKVSWEVMGVRDDAYARNHPFQVEETKPADKQGTYRHPEAHGAPASRGEAAQEREQHRQEQE